MPSQLYELSRPIPAKYIQVGPFGCSVGERCPPNLVARPEGDVVIESFTTDVKVIARAAAIWRRIEPTTDEIAVKGLKNLRST